MMAEALTLQIEDKALILGRLATPSLSEPRLLHAGCTGLTEATQVPGTSTRTSCKDAQALNVLNAGNTVGTVQY